MSSESPGFKPLKCLRCEQIMSYLGQLPLRSGGSGGAMNFLMGSAGGLLEKVILLDFYRCPGCGHLEFFDFDMSLPNS